MQLKTEQIENIVELIIPRKLHDELTTSLADIAFSKDLNLKGCKNKVKLLYKKMKLHGKIVYRNYV